MDATCYEGEMRYPTDTKLLWKGIEKAYGIMCGLSEKMNQHRPRTKHPDGWKANLAYRKQCRYMNGQTRKITWCLLALLGGDILRHPHGKCSSACPEGSLRNCSGCLMFYMWNGIVFSCGGKWKNRLPNEADDIKNDEFERKNTGTVCRMTQ